MSSMGQAFGRGSAHVCVSARQGMAMARQPCSSGPARWCVRLCTSKSSAFGLWEDGAHARAHGKAVAATWPRRSRNASKAGPRRCLAATRNEGDGGVPAQKRWDKVVLWLSTDGSSAFWPAARRGGGANEARLPLHRSGAGAARPRCSAWPSGGVLPHGESAGAMAVDSRLQLLLLHKQRPWRG